MVRAVYFDYHGVLDRRHFGGLLDVLIAQSGNDPQARTVLESLVDGYAIGNVAPIDFWKTINQKYGALAEQAGKKYILRVDPVLEVWQLINHLHERVSVGLFSDCPSDKRDVIIRAFNLPEFFDQLIFSCDTQQTKQDPNFYKHMLREGLYQPPDCLLIDDDERVTARAAQLGFTTHHFTDIVTLKQTLGLTS